MNSKVTIQVQKTDLMEVLSRLLGSGISIRAS